MAGPRGDVPSLEGQPRPGGPPRTCLSTMEQVHRHYLEFQIVNSLFPPRGNHPEAIMAAHREHLRDAGVASHPIPSIRECPYQLQCGMCAYLTRQQREGEASVPTMAPTSQAEPPATSTPVHPRFYYNQGVRRMPDQMEVSYPPAYEVVVPPAQTTGSHPGGNSTSVNNASRVAQDGSQTVPGENLRS